MIAALNAWSLVAVAAAGAACGLVNTIAGGGSLILFPVLLLVGLAPLDANVTNSVSTWAGYVGGVGGFRTEIRAQRRRLPRLVVATDPRQRHRLHPAAGHPVGRVRRGRAVPRADRHRA